MKVRAEKLREENMYRYGRFSSVANFFARFCIGQRVSTNEITKTETTRRKNGNLTFIFILTLIINHMCTY